MSNDFFSVIGNSLYNIKNSPFTRLGVVSSSIDDDVRQKREISYNPDRLFNPKKVNSLEEDYIEFKKDQRIKEQRIQFQMLKKQTNDEYEKQKSKINTLSKHINLRPFSIFGVYRSLCNECNKCGQYYGNFEKGTIHRNEKRQEIDYMQCKICNCPMNSHLIIRNKNSFCNQIWQHLKINQLSDQHLQINNHLILVFNNTLNNTSQQLIYHLLKRIGIQSYDYVVLNTLQFELNMAKCKIIQNGNKSIFIQSLLNLIQCIRNQQQWNWNDCKIPISEQFIEEYEIIKKIILGFKFNLKELENNNNNNNNNIIIFLCRKLISINNIHLIQYLKNNQNIINPFNFIWGSINNKQTIIAAEIFFNQYFKVHYKTYFIPSSNQQEVFQWNSSRFKDIIDYNNQILLAQNLKNISKNSIEKALSMFNYSKLNYILGQEILSEKLSKIGFKLTAKIGPDSFIIPVKKYPDFIQIKQKQIQHVIQNLYPQFLFTQRCILILRPFIVTHNYQEIIINVLRINNFIILRRIKIKLNQEQASYLAVLQHIQENKIAQYINLMTSSVSECVLVSKRSAIYQAYVLANGCMQGITNCCQKVLKQKPIIQIKQGKNIYENQLIEVGQEANNIHKPIFSGFSQVISMEKVLFGSHQENKYVTKKDNDQIMILEGRKKEKTTLKMSHKIKQAVLKQLSYDQFNYWLFTSKSDTITEELAGLLMPQCTIFQSIVVILKPGCTHLVDCVRKCLLQHRYHIIMEKSIQLSQVLAAQLIIGLQKVKIGKQLLKDIVQIYSKQKIHLFCISKISGRKQICSMLSGFTFLQNKPIIIQQNISDNDFCRVLLPVWCNQELILNIFNHKLSNPQQAIISLNRPDIENIDKFQILQFLIGTYYGVKLENLKMQTKLGKMSYYQTNLENAKLQSWFYAKTSNYCPNYVPLLFQYRQIGNITFCIQSYNGQPFMQIIIQQYQIEKQKINQNKKRKSLVLYLWSKKIAQFAKQLSTNKIQMPGIGLIKYKNGQYMGQLTIKEQQNLDKQFLKQMIEIFSTQKEIIRNIKRAQSTNLLKQKYKIQNLRLFPGLKNLQEGIRIIQTSKVSQLHLMDHYNLIDPENQKNQSLDLFSLTLYQVEPIISSKYWLIAQIYLFLLRWKDNGLQYNYQFEEILKFYSQFISINNTDIEMLQFQIYLRMLKQFTKGGQQWIKTYLIDYPTFQIQKLSNENQGRKRKLIKQKQYYKTQKQPNEQFLMKYQQYMNYKPQQQQNNKKQLINSLYNPDDPMHRYLLHNKPTINLLRENTNQTNKKGIYVEYDKRKTENEEIVLDKIKNQISKYQLSNQQEILYQTGLEKDLWYRRTKYQNLEQKSNKTQIAIQKQIGKFIQFKQQQKLKIEKQLKK